MIQPDSQVTAITLHELGRFSASSITQQKNFAATGAASRHAGYMSPGTPADAADVPLYATIRGNIR